MATSEHPPTRDGSAGALVRCTDLPADEFAREHWGERPLLTRAKQLPRDFSDLLSLDDVDDLVADRALRTPFFRTVADGAGKPVPTRSATAGNRRIADLVDPDALHAQRADGATLVLQSVHRMHPPVAAFCRELATELGHATQCNAYLTPGGDAQGFAFHHDTHDVFVLQVSGRKRWVVHEPVLPKPLKSQARSGNHLVPDGAEPLLDVELEPGDCLYLPRGFVHAAQTTDEHSVHLTVGVLTTTLYDVLTDALSLAARDERFRASLPMQPREHLSQLVPGLLRDAADWLEQLDPVSVEAVAQKRLAKAVPLEPLRLLAQSACAKDLAPDTAVRLRRGLRVAAREHADVVDLVLPDKTVTLPAAAAPALRLLLAPGDENPVTPADLAVEGLTVEDGTVIVRRLLREGVLVPR
jgi:lysine-specific demethylase/histidyl-hydroxylase NO66